MEIIEVREYKKSDKPLKLSHKAFNSHQTKLQKIFKLSPPSVNPTSISFFITAKHWVGILQIENYVIIVKPKVEDAKFGYMLSKVEIAYVHLLPEIVQETQLSEGFFKKLIKQFLIRSIEVLQISLRKGYRSKIISSFDIKGKLLVSKSIKSALKGDYRQYQKYNEFTADTYLNQIIKYTLEFLKPLVHHDFSDLIETLDIMLREVTILENMDTQEFEFIQYNHLNIQYKELIDFCEIILKQIIVEIAQGDASFHAFYLNSWDIYERFLRIIFTKYLSKYIVSKNHYGFSKSWDKKKLIPDITILEGEEVRFIIDAKYKTSVTATDLQQGSHYIRHLLLDKCEINRVCVYIYPQINEKIVMHTVEKTQDNGIFYSHSIDLSKIDNEDYLLRWIQSILTETSISL